MALKFGEASFKASHCLLSLAPRIPYQRTLLTSAESCGKFLPFSDIPKTSRVPILGSLPYFLKAGGQTYLHKYADNYHRELGPIFLDNIAGKELLFLSDPQANIQVYAAEGPTPEHFLLDIWKLYLEETGQKRGIFFMDGENWLKTRNALNKILLRPNSMVNHVQTISEVCKDLMDIWKVFPPTNLEYQLYCWNIECIADISLGKRLGFLKKLQNHHKGCNEIAEDEFVKAIHEIFLESANLYIYPAKLVKRFGLKSWKNFYSAVKIALEYGNQCVEEACIGCLDENADIRTKNSMLYKVLHEQCLDKETIKSVFVDLFLASADTTSHTACWALYLLGRYPEVADKARKQILSVLDSEKTLTLETLHKIPYLNGIIRETLRLYPTAPFLTRKVCKDIVLCGYSVSAGTMVISSLYSMGRSPEYFSDPHAFKPERWFSRKSQTANNESERLERKAYVPWGLGRRSCIGKRTAELELSLLIMEALKTFEWTVEEEAQMILRMITVPSKDIKLKLTSRST